MEGLGFVDTEGHSHVEARVVSTLRIERRNGHHGLEEIEEADTALEQRRRLDLATRDLAVRIDELVEPDLVCDKRNVELLGERHEDVVEGSWTRVLEVEEGLVGVEHVNEGSSGGIDVEPRAWLEGKGNQ